MTDFSHLEAPTSHVGYWYDRMTRSWIIQRLDADDNQNGDAIYIGSGKADGIAAALRLGYELGVPVGRISR